MPYEVRHGSHAICFEPPDLYVSRPVGVLSVEDCDYIIDAVRRFSEGKPYIFGIVNLMGLRSASVEARGRIMDILPHLRGLVYVTDKPQQRMAMSGMITAATSRARENHPDADFTVVFVKTEAEARAWVAERRSEAQARTDLEHRPA